MREVRWKDQAFRVIRGLLKKLTLMLALFLNARRTEEMPRVSSKDNVTEGPSLVQMKMLLMTL